MSAPVAIKLRYLFYHRHRETLIPRSHLCNAKTRFSYMTNFLCINLIIRKRTFLIHPLLCCRRFVMNIKLFIVMGISWICEVVSFFLKRYNLEWQDTIFYFSDVFNCLQGLLIFILFVLKSRVYLALRRRLGLDVRKKRACNNTTTLQDPYRVRKSASNSTITSTFAVSLAP